MSMEPEEALQWLPILEQLGLRVPADDLTDAEARAFEERITPHCREIIQAIRDLSKRAPGRHE